MFLIIEKSNDCIIPDNITILVKLFTVFDNKYEIAPICTINLFMVHGVAALSLEQIGLSSAQREYHIQGV